VNFGIRFPVAERRRHAIRALACYILPTKTEGCGAEMADTQRFCALLPTCAFLCSTRWRYEWESGELSASSGLANDKLWQAAERASVTQSNAPFATLSWLTRF
jgi:hypothetical protein